MAVTRWEGELEETMKYSLVIAAMALGMTTCFAQKGATAEKAIPPMFKQVEKLFEAKNADGIAKGMTSDFTETSMGQKVDRAKSLAGLKQFLGMFKTVHCKLTL